MQAPAHRVGRVVGQERLQVRQPVLDRDHPSGVEHAAELASPLLAGDRVRRQQGRFRDRPAQAVGLAQQDVRDGQGLQQTAVQGEDPVCRWRPGCGQDPSAPRAHRPWPPSGPAAAPAGAAAAATRSARPAIPTGWRREIQNARAGDRPGPGHWPGRGGRASGTAASPASPGPRHSRSRDVYPCPAGPRRSPAPRCPRPFARPVLTVVHPGVEFCHSQPRRAASPHPGHRRCWRSRITNSKTAQTHDNGAAAR